MPNTIQQFHQELGSIRNNVEEFSHAYPEVASELRLSAGRSADPHVEQLLQSFAWLTSQLRHDMQQQKHELPNHLLYSLYPHLMRSIPSMMVLKANVLPDGANFINGYQLDKDRLFKSKSISRRDIEGREKPAVVCQMKCCYDTPLWPLVIDDASIKSKNMFPFLDGRPEIKTVISISMHSEGADPISDYPLKKLRFFIADPRLRTKLYNMLSDNLCGCAIRVGGNVIKLPEAAIEWLGFDNEHSVLPQPKGLHNAYRLLQEYFNFSEKFYFFELSGIKVDQLEDKFELLLFFDRSESLVNLDGDSLQLNSFPAINLFPTTFKPLQLDHSQYEYRLLADERQYGQSEVHSVYDVKLLAADGSSKFVSPWLTGDDHRTGNAKQPSTKNSVHYLTRLAAPLSATTIGCDTIISLYDTSMKPATSLDQALSVKGQSSNRGLAESLRVGNRLSLLGAGALLDATVVSRPSLFKDAKLKGQSTLQLLSQLHLNYLSLLETKDSQGQASLKRFKQLLNLYSDSTIPSQQRQIEGIVAMQSEATVRRMGREAWRGHYRGSRLSLTVDESFYEGANVLLLGEVLSHFFALYTTLNHFVQLQLVSYQREGILKQWHPRIGEQVIL